MSVNYKTLADFEVATAEEAQNYFMDQAVIKVDDVSDLDTLPTDVKTAYVLNTGITMARDNTNVWVPLGGAAAVSETAPSNPQVGALWVKPSEVLPAPVRVQGAATAVNLTLTAWGTNVGSTAAIVLPKAAMCIVRYGAWLNAVSASTEARIRVKWSGAATGNSYDQMGGWAGVLASSNIGRSTQYMTLSLALPAGTTTFQIEGIKSGSGTPTAELSGIVITPVAWADAYVAGVS